MTEREDRLFGEIIALRVVLTKLIAHCANETAQFDEAQKFWHEQALLALETFEINDNDPARAENIRAQAERVVDELFSSRIVGR